MVQLQVRILELTLLHYKNTFKYHRLYYTISIFVQISDAVLVKFSVVYIQGLFGLEMKLLE